MDAMEKPGDFCWPSARTAWRPSSCSAAGRLLLAQREDGVATIVLLCPNCGARHAVGVKPVDPNGWDWNQDRDKPTLSPSIFFASGHSPHGTHDDRTDEQKACRWHGFLTAGEWVNA